MVDLSGRCACGAVRWETDASVNWAGHCHCESCRRATSAPFTSFFGVDRDKVRWTGEIAEILTSGGAVRRQFCPRCGTQLTYQAERWAHETHLYAATLDDPSRFEPKAHFHYAEKLSWIEVSDGLPRYAGTAEGTDPL